MKLRYIILSVFLSDLVLGSDPNLGPNTVIDEGVYVLTDDNFAPFLTTKPLALVEFYAPWCGHCKKLEPEYSKAAKKLSSSKIVLAKVDATKEPGLAKEYKVEGFPTLLIFRYGVRVGNYEGGRTANEIIDSMNRENDPDWKPPPSAVVVLTEQNFTKFIKEEKLTLVEWYAPWCKHCKQLEPEYEGAAQELKDWGIKLAKVDGTREKEIAEEFGVSGWPTLKMFRKGRVYEYGGAREKQDIINYMLAQAKSPSEERFNKLGLTNGMDRLEATVVGFFKDTNEFYEEYIAAANEMRGTFKFQHTFDESSAKHFGVELDSVVVFQPEVFWSDFEKKFHVLSKKSANNKEIMDFVNKNSVPLVGWRTKRNAFKYQDRPLVVVYYDVNFDHQYLKDTQFIRKKVVEVAKDYIDYNIKFAVSNEDEFEDEIKAFGFEDSGEDVNIGCFSAKLKFRMEPVDDFESDDLAQFIKDLRAKKVKPHMKSKPIPKDDKEDAPVKKIVTNNYDDEVHRSKKDVVMFFHAPWCGHCKEFDPEYKKIAKKVLKTNENIVFAKMDATSNDVPYMYPTVQGYPTLYFLSANEKYDPIPYQGDRSETSLKDWINRHASVFDGETNGIDDSIESFTKIDFEEEIKKKKPAKDEL